MYRIAIALLPELAGPWDAVIIALVGGLLLYSIDSIIRGVIIPVLGLIPVVGRPLADGLGRVLGAVENVVHAWAEARLKPLTDLIKRVDNRLRSFARANTLAHVAIMSALRRLRFDVIPRVQLALLQFIQAQVAAVLTFIRGVEHNLAQYAQQLSQAAIRYAAQRADQSLAYTLQTRQQLLQLDQRLAQYAQQLTVQAMTRADQEIERAAKLAQLDDQAVITYAQQLTGQSEQYARQLVQAQQQRTDAQVATAEQYAQQVGTAVLTFVIPAIATLMTRIKTIEDSPCQQECQTLGQLGQNLDGLDLAALLALLLGAATHPKEGAAAFRNFLEPGAELASAPLLGLFK